MVCEIARTQSLFSLLIDEAAYRLVRRIHDRSRARLSSAPPLFAPTTDLIGHRLISTGIFERTQIEGLDALLDERRDLIDQFKNKLGLFIDVGANIGFYTTRYAERFEKVLAVEANPITFDVLKSNLALSQISNASAVCVGASDKPGTLPLTIPSGGVMGWASFESGDVKADRVVHVPTRTIDELTEEYAPHTAVTLIKIDVEGHEAKVLRGAATVLRRHKPVVLYEQLSQSAGAECADLLRAAGYDRFLTFTRRIRLMLPFSKCPVTADAVDPKKLDRCTLICGY